MREQTMTTAATVFGLITVTFVDARGDFKSL